ncbi:PLP-dependent aminotransferase family protein [Jatrophihabitans telluris]|uniref:PLP-dependent aminotransferase family protein n=1 Tax=Jatrophihabitans telluris TaxID=2038343 RepID=A0ABY4R1M1_9ACTN|nr:PLP-dependent aminotransferase family protein [Jatrophihabitans telluris]UQX89823.1 PLP-dependent aminotransferase family protein [Jatrophihabitans telluris]
MLSNAPIGTRTLLGLLPDLSEQPGPRYRALSNALAALLLDGRVSPGSRLPSERDLARELKLSRATTTAAFDALAADGLLIRRQGSGSYLTLPAAARMAGPGSRIARRPGDAALVDLSIASLPAIAGVMGPAMAAVTEDVARYATRDGYYPYGIPELREAVAERYRRRGVATTPEQILITNGAQHGLDLVLRVGIGPGDRVVTELPSYPGALESLRAHGARHVPVPLSMSMTEGRWELPSFAAALRQSSPRLAYLIPDFHNPTGALGDGATRAEIAHAARRSGTRLIVDESFVDIDLRTEAERGDSARPIVAMAELDESVISLGSLSKPIWGGLRVGWIRTDPDTVQRLAAARARNDMAGPVIEQLIAHHLLADLDASLMQRRDSLRQQRDCLLASLAELLPAWRPSRALGGLSIWIELDHAGATPLSHLLEHRGLLLSPGSRFAADGTLERQLRLPFALPQDVLRRAVETIAEAWGELEPGRLPGDAGSLVTA